MRSNYDDSRRYAQGFFLILCFVIVAFKLLVPVLYLLGTILTYYFG
jgi:hypothetical protein